MSAKKPIGQILVEHGFVSRADVDAALAAPRPGVPLASALVELGVISELDALKALSEQLGVPGIDVGQVIIRVSDLELLPREVATGHRLLPILAREDRLFCAMAVPTDAKILDELEFVTGKRVFAYVALSAPLARVIEEAYAAKEQGSAYYVGPRTPDEALDRAGLPRAMRTGAVAQPAAPPKLAPTPSPAPPPAGAAAAQRRPPVAPTAAASSPHPGDPAQAPRRHVAPATPSATPDGGRVSPRPASQATPDHDVRRGSPRDPSERGARLEKSFRPSSMNLKAVDTHVVVDDAMQRTSAAGVAEEPWSDGNSEMSVVAPLPGPTSHKTPAIEGQKTVLIVDDDADIRRLLRTVLTPRGLNVIEADRGLLALQLVKQSPPDLLLLDVMLPEVHGFEIARRIRGSDRYGDIPIIMISAVYRGPQVAQDAKTGYGVDAFIEKPFRIADVVKAVDTALMRASRKTAPKRDPEETREEAQKLLADGMAAYQTGDTALAMELLERGTRVDPLSYRLRYHLGLLYGKCDRLYDGIRELERATELNPKQFAAWKNLAVLYQQAGFRAKAVGGWSRAADLAPDDETRRAIHQQLAALG